MTPEGKVKKQVKEFLNLLPRCRYFMPVMMGFGRSGIPDIDGGIYQGFPFTIETKALNKSPTPWQVEEATRIMNAGGAAFVFAKPFTVFFDKPIKIPMTKNYMRWYAPHDFESFVELWNFYFSEVNKHAL